jgi:hypothetical protein
MNTRLPSRTVALVLLAFAMAGAIVIQSASAPVLTIERMGKNQVLLTWTNDSPGFVLQELHPLGETGSWQTLSLTPQLLEGGLGVTLSIQTNESRFFRLKARGLEFINHREVLCWSSGGAFDASILLSADSIQDPFELNWTISSNAVGAIVGPGGVVNLGTDVGSFTVTASATNGAGQDSFTLNTIRLEFTSTSSVPCWQPNGIFDARALLSADSTTNDSLVQWMISGSGPASIDSFGLIRFGAGAGTYTVQAAALSNAACATTFGLDVLKLAFVTNATAACWQSNGMFNASALLTSESTTNRSLLTWTIAGTGPATIDSAGVVSFGAGPGDYTVQVNGLSNTLCAAALVLEVTKLEFATTATAVCWLTNGTFDAKALLAPDSIANDSLVVWSIVGDGPATIDRAGLVIFGSGPGSYLVQVSDQSNAVCVPTLALDVLKLESVANAAAVCWQSNGTFDARALLSAGSTTNSSLLAWTIAGSGSATIDGAGLVSFGPAPGSYAIQVAGRSNALCAAASTLEVVKLQFAANTAAVCWQSNGTFDAWALLTSDSITNHSLLTWTLIGSGPATIDSAGLVSFGPWPGSYTVQVTDLSHGVCAPSLALDVLKLQFVTTAAAACWQSNGMFNAKALLSSDSTTNDSLLTWTISGSGPANVDGAGLVSFGVGPGNYTVQVTGRSNTQCAAALSVDVPKLQFAATATAVCWQTNATFDAKTLLTSDSITSNSLLTWTLIGSGPATIDSAGLVSFGPAPGSYTVQVTDQSNAVCAASLALDVLKLEPVANGTTVCWQTNGTFDARSLLTADSSTNNRLLVWTIAGGGPATIDSAGLVSFGPAAGSYTIQVAGWSNAVCALSLMLDVLKLGFAANTATACWQTNGTFDATALLTADCTTNDNLLAWSIAGTGPATIDSAGLVSFGPGSGSYTIRVDGRSNAVCAAALTLDVIKLQLATNATAVCWQSNGTFNARALFTSDSTTNDSLLN